MRHKHKLLTASTKKLNRRHPHPYTKQPEYFVLECLTTLSYRADNLDHYLHEIAGHVSRLLQSDWTIITICQETTGSIVASTLDLGDCDRGFSVHGTLAGEVARRGKLLFIQDVHKEASCHQLPEQYMAYLGIPLQSPSGHCIGTICSMFEQTQEFRDDMIRLVNLFAEKAAIALDNYHLYQQQQQTLSELQQTNQRLQAEIQERQQIEQEMLRLAEIGELAAMIVHEVRNPLTTILLGLMALKDSHLTEKAQLRLMLAIEEAERLQRLLNEILVYTKRQSLQRTALELNQFMAEEQKIFWSLPATLGRHIRIDSSLPEAWILGDRDKLKQVFVNLIKNACEAADEGSVITWSSSPGTSTNQVRICIHNDGDPIPPEKLEQLGTPFYTTKAEGNGLGLAIVRRIIEAHGGELIIRSEAGIGTHVCVQLALLEPEITE